jgi:hypothetical protein
VQHTSFPEFSEKGTASTFRVADSVQRDPKSVTLKMEAILPSEDILHCAKRKIKRRESQLINEVH